MGASPVRKLGTFFMAEKNRWTFFPVWNFFVQKLQFEVSSPSARATLMALVSDRSVCQCEQR